MERRTKVELKFQPDGEEVPGPIRTFKLERTTYQEARRNDREHWLMDSSKRDFLKTEVLAEGITRSTLSKLIADAADWLSYIEEG